MLRVNVVKEEAEANLPGYLGAVAHDAAPLAADPNEGVGVDFVLLEFFALELAVRIAVPDHDRGIAIDANLKIAHLVGAELQVAIVQFLENGLPGGHLPIGTDKDPLLRE